MDLALDALSIVTTIVATAMLWLHVRPKLTVTTVRTDEVLAPEWGTRARKEWHRELRDYHANMVSQAGEAVYLKDEFAPKD